MNDREAMAQALALAALGEGTTRPNPLVGCVIVRDGAIVGTGFHRTAGGPHAEIAALRAAGAAARGATLYVTLEPCAHHGRTPPCAEAIAAAGVARVVAGTGDPNPLVDGRGFAYLRDAGVTVVVGVLEDEARALNAAFLSAHRRHRPWVTVKAAQSWDGLIAAESGSSTWVTGPAARRHAHRLRFTHDAILVGAGTLRRDDPRLTVRLDGVVASPVRVVLSTDGRLDPGSQIFQDAGGKGPRSRVYVADAVDAPRASLGRVADVVAAGNGAGGIDLALVLADLAAQGVQSVLVEGGGRTIAAFLEAGLADDVALFVAPRLIGARGGTPLVDRAAASTPDAGAGLRVRTIVPVGPDDLVLASIERG